MKTKSVDRNDGFSENYKHRMGLFIKKMLAEPIIEQDPYDPYKKQLEVKSFRYTSNTMERINEQQNKNSYCDTTPSQIFNVGTSPERIMKLRQREKDKEIQPPSIRVNMKSGLERVFDSLMNRNNSVLPKSEVVDAKTLRRIKRFNKQQNSPYNQGAYANHDSDGSHTHKSFMSYGGHDLQDIVKPFEICPSLHNKTHFKAAMSIFMGHPGVLEDNDKSIEKILNEYNTKRNYKVLLEKEHQQEIQTDLRKMNGSFMTTSGGQTFNIKNNKTPDPRLKQKFNLYNTTNDQNKQNMKRTEYTNSMIIGTKGYGTVSMRQQPFLNDQISQSRFNKSTHALNNEQAIQNQEIQELNETVNPQQVTRQMLLNCKIMRKRNQYVMPLIAKVSDQKTMLVKSGILLNKLDSIGKSKEMIMVDSSRKSSNQYY